MFKKIILLFLILVIVVYVNDEVDIKLNESVIIV